MRKVEVRIYKDGDNWDAECEEVGLVGYADPDINVVRKNVFDSIKFTLEVEGVEQEIEFTEKIISIEELG
uniref:hypothetical protein n=1 Tax=Candidatus Nanopelagicus sp. TaxID=2518620 RepID=UPI004049CD9D